MARRARGTPPGFATWLNLIRGVSSEGFGRIEYYTKVRQLLDSDRSVAAYFAGDTQELPSFYMQRIQRDLGPLWKFLPPGALYHDANAYLAKQSEQPDVKVVLRRARPALG